MNSPFSEFNHGRDRSGRQRRRLVRHLPIRVMLPNIVTLMAICAGLTAVRFAMEERWDFSIIAIIFAAILDAIDGRVARLLKGTSRFGAELDSLADFVNFGVAPSLVLYYLILYKIPTFGWIAVLIFSICTAMRLARFNTSLDEPQTYDWQVNFFVGVPTPAGAMTVLLPVYMHILGFLPDWHPVPLLVMLGTILVGLLMVSRLPTYSGKKIKTKVRRDLVMPILVLVIFVIALFLYYPFLMLAATTVGYLVTLPFSYRSWNRLKKDSKINETEPS